MKEQKIRNLRPSEAHLKLQKEVIFPFSQSIFIFPFSQYYLFSFFLLHSTLFWVAFSLFSEVNYYFLHLGGSRLVMSKNPKKWSVEQVGEWLTQLKLGKYKAAFSSNRLVVTRCCVVLCSVVVCCVLLRHSVL